MLGWKQFKFPGANRASETEHLHTDGVVDGSMKRRLLNMRTKKERGPEIMTDENSVLIDDFLNEDRKARLANASKIGKSYWRHVSGDAAERDANRTAHFENILNPTFSFEKQSEPNSVEGVGMGLELSCLATFLTHGAANKAVKSYFLEKRNALADGTYTATESSGTPLSLSSSNYASPSTPIAIESSETNNELPLRITANPDATIDECHDIQAAHVQPGDSETVSEIGGSEDFGDQSKVA